MKLYTGIKADGIQRYNHNQKNNGQRYQQGIQCNLVGRLLPGSAFHQGDHPIQEAVARIGCYLNFQPIGYHGRSPCDGAEVTAGFPHHRRGLSGNGRLIHRRNALDDFPVTGNDFSGIHHYHVTLAQFAGKHGGFRPIVSDPACLGIFLGLFQAGCLGFAPAFRHRLRKVRKQNRDKQHPADNAVVRPQVCALRHIPKQIREEGQQQCYDAAHFYDKHHRIFHHVQRVQFGKGTNNRLAEDAGRH